MLSGESMLDERPRIFRRLVKRKCKDSSYSQLVSTGVDNRQEKKG